MSIFAGSNPSYVAQGKERGTPPLSHGKVTEGIGEREMAMKECGNINLSFVKHWFHVLPWMICYSLSLLKTELLIKIYLNGNCQVFGKIQMFNFLNSFTVSARKPMQLYIYIISLSNLFWKNIFKNRRKCLWTLPILLQETIKMDWIL